DKIVIVAHSLGIHALQNYCQRALEIEPKATKVFAAVILSRPDVDFSSFKNSEEALKKFSGKLMLLCARNDINLKLSSFIRRAGYSFVEDPRPVRDNHLRLGQASVASGVADQLAVYDISQLRLKHLIPYKLIAGLLTGETSSYLIERAAGGVMEVKNRL
ncbi:alpha/beta hydrolase, partial [bacterium]|nr:alpha/beta hydrolase [bacterium]